LDDGNVVNIEEKQKILIIPIYMYADTLFYIHFIHDTFPIGKTEYLNEIESIFQF